MRCKRIVAIEDTHGDKFHRRLIEGLMDAGVIRRANQPKVVRLPAKKCNKALYRKLIGRVLDSDCWKILVVIDKEHHRTVDEARRNDILRHITRHRDRFNVVVVDPRHEAWLCIGLGLGSGRCRSEPEAEIERYARRKYDKILLNELSNKININNLLGEHDFEEYIRGLKWLLS